MKLLSIETTAELQCISDLINSELRVDILSAISQFGFAGHEGVNLTGEFYTSGSDYQIANKFIWCAENGSNLASSDNHWGTGEPSDVNIFGFAEECVSIQLATGLAKKNLIYDVNCADSYRFICEVNINSATH
jgi:hypothetical protein